MSKPLHESLIDEIHKKEIEMNNRECRMEFKRVQLIRIHPEFFYELASEADILKYLTVEAEMAGKFKFCGISMWKDPKVKKWELD